MAELPRPNRPEAFSDYENSAKILEAIASRCEPAEERVLRRTAYALLYATAYRERNLICS
jgi:hypothetical protein